MSVDCDFESMLKEVTEICDGVIQQRDRLYGKGWIHSGLQGIANQMFGKQQRLKQLVLKQSYGHEYTGDEIESIFDTLVDLTNYSRMAAVCLAAGLWYFDDDQNEEILTKRELNLDVLRSTRS